MENKNRRSALKAISTTALGMVLFDNQAIASENIANKIPFVLRAAEGRFKEEYHFWGMDLYLKIAGKDTNEEMTTFYGTYHKNDGPPLHVHYGEDEVFYILEGEFLVQVGEDKYTLRIGDTIFLPKNIPHTFLVLSDTAKMLFMTQPSGKVEGLFKKLASLDKSATPEEIQKIHIEHNLKIVGPRLAAN